MNRNNSFWIVTTIVVLVIGVGGYATLAARGVVPQIPLFTVQTAPAEETEASSPTDTTARQITKETPPNTPPPTAILDIKEVYDTTMAPPIRSDEPRSGAKEITIRGKLRVIKAQVLCQTKPCPQPDSSDYRFEFQDRYEPITYKLSVRKTGDPVVKNLTDGEVYIVRGTLNYSFSDSGKATLSFDPTAVVQ
jgi:hypothetical protein